MTVHPRTHGELEYWQSQDDKQVGSSPYTRGTLTWLENLKNQGWFIPVHTGNSTMNSPDSPSYSVHPRTHGELAPQLTMNVVHNGSSPYTRGTLCFYRLSDYIDRFIPVHTGNSNVSGSTVDKSTVHPRTHGELSSFVPFILP